MNEIAAKMTRETYPMIGGYPDYANPDLLEAIPLAARVVLDIGCGAGALGAAYLKRNPKARMLGIDTDADAIAVADTRLTEAVCADVETRPMPFAVPEGIDCIIYGDVLEHLRDPWALLRRHAELLNPDGTMVVCIPNVEHWSIAYRLMKGTFEYEDIGLLDRTHLRWFTPRMIGSALQQAGLILADVRPRPHDRAEAERFVAAMEPSLRTMGIDPAEYLNRAAPLQFIWRAKRLPRPRLVVSATMLSPIGGVSDVRVIEPVRALATDCTVFASVMAEHDLRPVIEDALRIAVLHRPLLLAEAGIARVKALLDKGYLVVSEFDDHPVFLENKGVPADQLLTFKAVHAVQTSTVTLAEALAEHNPEIGVFPNAMMSLPEPRNFQNPERLTLFFAALNRENDWAPFMPVLNEVLRAVGSRLNVMVMHDRGFFEALETTHKEFQPLSDYRTYLDRLADAEIGFMPLADTVFNQAKSDLKFIEAGACRVVPLASPVVYEKSLADGETGLIFRSPDQLRMQLLRLLAYPDAARKLADTARAYVAGERMLAYQAQARIDWYRALWTRREELTAALRERVPALFS